MKKIAEGAEAEIYSIKFMGIPAILKRRNSKAYRIKELDTRLRRQRTKNEARALAAAHRAGAHVPMVLFLAEFDIVTNVVAGEQLSTATGTSNSNIRAYFKMAGAELALLHTAGIAHGDYTPANILVAEIAQVIDFGLSQIGVSEEEKALDIMLMKRSISVQHYRSFIAGYSASNKDAQKVLAQAAEIDKRSRYKVRTLATVKM